MGVAELVAAFNTAGAPLVTCQKATLGYERAHDLEWQVLTFSGIRSDGTAFTIIEKAKPGQDVMLVAAAGGEKARGDVVAVDANAATAAETAQTRAEAAEAAAGTAATIAATAAALAETEAGKATAARARADTARAAAETAKAAVDVTAEAVRVTAADVEVTRGQVDATAAAVEAAAKPIIDPTKPPAEEPVEGNPP